MMNHFQILLYIHYESSNRIHNGTCIYIYIPVSPIISKVHHQIRLTVSHEIWGARASPPEHPWMSFRRHAVRVIEFTSIVILYYIILYKWEMLVEDLEKHMIFRLSNHSIMEFWNGIIGSTTQQLIKWNIESRNHGFCRVLTI